MNRRQLLKLGALGAVAPRAIAAPAVGAPFHVWSLSFAGAVRFREIMTLWGYFALLGGRWCPESQSHEWFVTVFTKGGAMKLGH